MFQSQREFSCSECGKSIEIGEPFLATATFPARSLMQSESIDSQFLQYHGEVLCNSCAIKRLGVEPLAKLKGAYFENPALVAHLSKRKK